MALLDYLPRMPKLREGLLGGNGENGADLSDPCKKGERFPRCSLCSFAGQLFRTGRNDPRPFGDAAFGAWFKH